MERVPPVKVLSLPACDLLDCGLAGLAAVGSQR